MKLSSLFVRRNPGRELAVIGAEKRRQTVRETTRKLRAELGLEPHPALERSR